MSSTLGIRKSRVVRESYIARKVVVTNGLPGCGKTMMAAIIGSLDRVELMRYNYHLEHTCVLHFLGLLEDSAAQVLVRGQTDLDLYSAMMSRETNFRFSDLSSVWRDSNPFRYLRRLVQAGDGAVIPRIERERPILHLVTHFLLGTGRPLLDGLGDRLLMVEVVRHPLYMIKQWHAWMPRASSDPRFFFLRIEHEGEPLPWFAKGWEDLYLRSNRMDRVIYSIEKQWRQGQRVFRSLSSELRERILIVPFEQFVVRPGPYMAELETLLGTKVIARTRRMVKKQRVPRKKWAEGIDIKIYREYGWEPPGPGADERREMEKRREFAVSEASSDAMESLDRLCAEYEAEFLPDLNR